MKVNAKFRPFLHTDSQVLLSTAGVLGETFIDIDSTQAKGPEVSNDAELPSKEVPDIQDVVRSSQSTLQNVNILVGRLDQHRERGGGPEGFGRKADLRQTALQQFEQLGRTGQWDAQRHQQRPRQPGQVDQRRHAVHPSQRDHRQAEHGCRQHEQRQRNASAN